MKYVLLLITTVLISNISRAQDNTSCYNQWAKAFEVRGSEEVKDGWHDGVVLSIRRGSKNVCYTARVRVDKSIINEIYIKYVDGKFESYRPQWKYDDQKATINNGISKTLQTIDDELVNIIFINHLKPKKTAYELAPLPNPEDF